ncbi:MAG: hypothetical protein H7A24_17310 [Leptospiraceae bacterium]|nr:hypothetical protein [Leptospiraceae bacterium]MCP5513651.1 hypothetical protein [Leptospiraceae bacterium]
MYPLFFYSIPLLLVLYVFVYYFLKKKVPDKFFFRGLEILVLIIYPGLYLLFMDWGMKNDCCDSSATFSPDHRLSIYVLIFLGEGSYFYSRYRKELSPPLIELILNCLLIIGVVLNGIIAIHLDLFFAILGNLPIILLFLLLMIENHRKLMEAFDSGNFSDSSNYLVHLILKKDFFLKFPILLFLSVPVLLFISAVLYLFGQKPDSMISAFTESYQHNLSVGWQEKCVEVACKGHYLCSVASGGHRKLVQPIRMGVRNQRRIPVNRQLLIANAFEGVLESSFPHFHSKLRSLYDRLGDLIWKNYSLFESAWISDMIYLLMKPAEWIFLIVLYSVYKRPENQIAIQYTDRNDWSGLLSGR